ncbi:hypothetical protein LSH36_202g10040 [Paralvinella palmiformis]|uniref:G-protein coupled receptor Mth2 n=1 Tax=Paralvinella palmiformis TaxID=53620 RepID=A0AAD9JQ98_9ANNE|nr:hypothetical protein LSH36_202g10040 [Paralvinella palmiformis]
MYPISSFILLHVTFWSDAIGQLVAYTCDEKSSCLSNLTNEKHRTCWCDRQCLQYGDCCHDYQSTTEEENRHEKYKEKWKILKSRVKCKHFPPISNRPLYIITDCPRDPVSDDVIRARCEQNPSPPMAFTKRLLMAKMAKMRHKPVVRVKKTAETGKYQYLNFIPVIGWNVNVVYRNAFCALCNNEFRFLFFNLELFSRRAFAVEELRNSSALRNRLREAQLHRKYRYRAPTGFRTRACIATVSDCPSTWTDNSTARTCGGATALVRDYVTGRVYRNENCALCNAVNETRLRCESRYLVSAKYPPIPNFPLPYALLIDVNTGILRPSSAGVGYARQPVADEEEVLPVCRRRIIASGSNLLAEFTVTGLVSDGSCDRLECPVGYVHPTNRDRSTCVPSTGEDVNVTYVFKFGAGLGYLTLVGNCLSMVGLSVLLTVYAAVGCLRNTPGKCLMSLAASLLISQLLFTVAADQTDAGIVCVLVAIVEHYLFLAYAIWMNVMAFDVWRAFRIGSPSYRASAKSRAKTFALYSLYAWIAPFPVVTLSVLADQFELGVRPRYGQQFCWISDRRALLWFFGLPLGGVVLANSVFFLCTLHNIRVTSAATACLRRPSDVTSSRRRLVLYVRLAVVMAMTWLSGFLAALVDHVILWYAFTLANAFQGLYICAAFVFTEKVYANTILKLQRLTSRRSRTFSSSTTRDTTDFRLSSNNKCSRRSADIPQPTGDIGQ